MAAAPETVIAQSAQLTVGEILCDQTSLQPTAIVIEVGAHSCSYRTFNSRVN